MPVVKRKEVVIDRKTITTPAELQKLSDEVTAGMMKLQRAGWSLREIADVYKCSPPAVLSRLKASGKYKPHPRGRRSKV